MENKFDNYENEFWFHVSNQDEIPIAGSVKKSIDSHLLYKISRKLPKTDCKAVDYLKNVISNDVDTIDTLRTIVGITDKRMYLELSYIFNKEVRQSGDEVNILGESVYMLQKHSINFFKRQIEKKDDNSDEILNVITKYLVDRGVLLILGIFKDLSLKEVDEFVENTLLPKEIQQEKTKRRGHGAEKELAKLFHDLHISMIPKKKYVNPMESKDPNVDKDTFELSERDERHTWSMDIILKDRLGNLQIYIQSLIHTSDPGQYGVNKSAETILVKNGLERCNQTYNTKKELWGLVDGVGFIENPANTVFKMIPNFDTFVQLKSLYKAGLRLHKLGIVNIKGIRFDMNFYTQQQANWMYEKYADGIQLFEDKDMISPNLKEIRAGKAWLYV